MALMHFTMRSYSKNGSQQSPRTVVTYLQRAERFADRTDLRHTEVASMPVWAQNDPVVFFQASERYERRNGRWALSLELGLPREMTQREHRALVHDFVTSQAPHRPSFWVIHEPVAIDGQPQPHAHVLLSERHGDFEGSPSDFFTRANPKDSFLTQRRAPGRLREAWACAVNWQLEQGGYPARMSPQSLKEQRRGLSLDQGGGSQEKGNLGALEGIRDRQEEYRVAVAWWDAEKKGLDTSDRLTFFAQVRTQARQGSPGTYPSPETLKAEHERLERAIAAYRQYHTQLDVAIAHPPGDTPVGNRRLAYLLDYDYDEKSPEYETSLFTFSRDTDRSR